MYNNLNETIDVFVNFTKNSMTPICFSWRNQDYNIDNLNFKHTSKLGNKKLFHFSVTAQKNTYKLTFDPIDTIWILEEIYTEEMQQIDSLNDAYKITY